MWKILVASQIVIVAVVAQGGPTVPTCPTGEVYLSNETDCSSMPFCLNDRCGFNPMTARCPLTMCASGCYCRQGYRRDCYDDCVPARYCDCLACKCGAYGKYFSGESPSCRVNCGHDSCADLYQAVTCTEDCTEGCYCNVEEGYYKNHYGKCVFYEECSNYDPALEPAFPVGLGILQFFG